jgi:predicted helicase
VPKNANRIKKQNQRKISVIIGNPPYNANQQNENDNNKNRAYTEIDKRIKDTYIKNSTAQKTKLYDMYSRFYRWAMDRLNENGVLHLLPTAVLLTAEHLMGFVKAYKPILIMRTLSIQKVMCVPIRKLQVLPIIFLGYRQGSLY